MYFCVCVRFAISCVCIECIYMRYFFLTVYERSCLFNSKQLSHTHTTVTGNWKSRIQRDNCCRQEINDAMNLAVFFFFGIEVYLLFQFYTLSIRSSLLKQAVQLPIWPQKKDIINSLFSAPTKL